MATQRMRRERALMRQPRAPRTIGWVEGKQKRGGLLGGKQISEVLKE